MSNRPILTGYAAIDEWAEDWSDWSGFITGPVDPTGANLAWQDPIPMIETRAVEKLQDALQALVDLKDHKDKHGKDRAYTRAQPEAWRVAREVLAEITKGKP